MFLKFFHQRFYAQVDIIPARSKAGCKFSNININWNSVPARSKARCKFSNRYDLHIGVDPFLAKSVDGRIPNGLPGVKLHYVTRQLQSNNIFIRYGFVRPCCYIATKQGLYERGILEQIHYS